MAKFVITHKMAGKTSAADYRESRRQLERALRKMGRLEVLSDSEPDHPLARRSVMIEAEPAQIREYRRDLHPDVMIEEEIPHRLHASAAGAAAALAGKPFAAQVTGAGAGLASARVTLMYPEGGGLGMLTPGLTGPDGKVAIDVPAAVHPSVVLAEPAGGFWGMHSDFEAQVTLSCPALPGGGPLAWWHHEVGIRAYDETRGAGMRIGLVGTGVGPNACLSHVTRIDGKSDVGRHDTHVAGILAARPAAAGQFAGIVPGAHVFSARVFTAGPGAEPVPDHAGVIAHAIDVLARPEKHGGYHVHLINLSFGAPAKLRIIHDAIQHAFEHGVLCVCSAGNNFGGALDYPAAFPETAGVTALGLKNWGPEGSITRHWTPSKKSMFGRRNLFLASLSAAGKGVFCAAPGSGIISTMPRVRSERPGRDAAPYAAMDGTSLASPMACGVLAAILAQSKKYASFGQVPARASFAKRTLRSACLSAGLKKEFQGAGVPRLPSGD